MSLDLTSNFHQFNFGMGNLNGHSIYAFGEFGLDAEKLMLYRGLAEIPLPPKVVKTLAVLVENAGQILSKDELMEPTQRLWKELGGTDQGWSAYLARVDSKTKPESAEVATWNSKDTALAEFELTDLDGRKWSTADLKGKVALINLWATWCGPCREELPYVQKLREKMKDRKDVVILEVDEVAFLSERIEHRSASRSNVRSNARRNPREAADRSSRRR